MSIYTFFFVIIIIKMFYFYLHTPITPIFYINVIILGKSIKWICISHPPHEAKSLLFQGSNHLNNAQVAKDVSIYENNFLYFARTSEK